MEALRLQLAKEKEKLKPSQPEPQKQLTIEVQKVIEKENGKRKDTHKKGLEL